MLYLGYAFMMPNEKLQLQKNQLIRSAAGWSKDHIMLSLTPADTYTKSVNWIKMNFPTVEIDCHPSRRTFLMDSSPALTQSLMDAVWTDGLSEILSFPRLQTLKLWFSAVWGNPTSPVSTLKKNYPKPLEAETSLLRSWEVISPPRLRSPHLELALKWLRKVSCGMLSLVPSEDPKPCSILLSN